MLSLLPIAGVAVKGIVRRPSVHGMLVYGQPPEKLACLAEVISHTSYQIYEDVEGLLHVMQVCVRVCGTGVRALLWGCRKGVRPETRQCASRSSRACDLHSDLIPSDLDLAERGGSKELQDVDEHPRLHAEGHLRESRRLGDDVHNRRTLRPHLPAPAQEASPRWALWWT